MSSRVCVRGRYSPMGLVQKNKRKRSYLFFACVSTVVGREIIVSTMMMMVMPHVFLFFSQSFAAVGWRYAIQMKCQREGIAVPFWGRSVFFVQEFKVPKRGVLLELLILRWNRLTHKMNFFLAYRHWGEPSTLMRAPIHEEITYHYTLRKEMSFPSKRSKLGSTQLGER